MGQRAMERNVAMKVVPIGQEQGQGEFASNMAQKLRLRFAAMKDVPTKSEGRKEFV